MFFLRIGEVDEEHMPVDFAGDLGRVITWGCAPNNTLNWLIINALILCRSKLKLTNYLLLSAIKSPNNKNEAF